MSTAEHDDTEQWSCPACTLLNSNVFKKCLACNHEYKPKKYANIFKSAFSNISNGVNGLINGFNAPTTNNMSYDQDVIEIDPKTNRPLNSNTAATATNRPSSQMTFRPTSINNNSNTISNSSTNKQANAIWTCKSCSYGTNPVWSVNCEMCYAKQDEPSRSAASSAATTSSHALASTSTPASSSSTTITSTNRQQKHISNNHNHNHNATPIDRSDETVYDKSLNEFIYDYARIWQCKQCTFINFSKDQQCELCLLPRHNANSSTLAADPTDGGSSPQAPSAGATGSTNSSTSSSSSHSQGSDSSQSRSIKDRWVCKRCTYFNSNSETKCILCATTREFLYDDANNNNDNPLLNNQRTSSTASTASSSSNSSSSNGSTASSSSSASTSSSSKRLVVLGGGGGGGDDEWVCEICSYKNKPNTSVCTVCSYDKDDIQNNNFYYNNSNNGNIKPSSYYTSNNTNNNNKSNGATANAMATSSRASSSNVISSNMNTALSPSRSQRAKSITKTYANATTKAERIWNSIVRYCKDQNIKFVDDSFPPCNKSLFINPNKKPESIAQLRGGSIKWLSPEYIRTHSDEHGLKWTVYNDPKFSDIKQGLLGNCWLLSGLAVLIEQPEMLRKIIITKDYCSQGCYQVRLCHNGEWQTVIVDDLFPCDSNGSLIYSQASRKQLWVPLIEKAMAKLNGSFESLIAGQTVEGLSALTGYPCDSIRLEHTQPNNEEEIDFYMIWARLLSMKEAGYAIAASCGRSDITDDNIFTQRGLLPRHAYSILNVKEINGHQLIQLRNPWGRYTWLGDWCESSSKWTPELRKALGLKPQSSRGHHHHQNGSHLQDHNHHYNSNQRHTSNDLGVFWMSFNDFVKYFCSIDICKTRLDLFESRMTGYFNWEGTREMQAYHLVVFETSEFDIGLFHKTVKNRRENSDLDLCFVVLRIKAGRTDKVAIASKRSVRKFIGCEHIFEPGEYLIVPMSFNFWYTTGPNSKKTYINGAITNSPDPNEKPANQKSFTYNNLYNLVIHSPKEFFVEQEMHSTFLLADTIIQLCMSNGSKTSAGLDNACIYTMTKGWSGILVIAENCNERAYLHVELDCERSNNVVSTRQTLTTKDSVPPLHRQVLIVLTHLEGSSGYSIQYSIKYRLSSNPFLNTWPGNEGQMITNYPEINKQTFGLHAPRSVFL